MELLDTVLSEVSTLLDMPLPLQLSPPLLMPPQLPLMLMLLQLPPMLMLLQLLPMLMLLQLLLLMPPQLSTLLLLPLPPPQLSTMLDTRLIIMSSTFPRSLSRGTPPLTPPATSSTMPQLSVLPSHTTLLSLLPLLPELPELSLSKNTQKKMQNSSRTSKVSSSI